MNTNLTPSGEINKDQAITQQIRFDNWLLQADLVRIGKTYISLGIKGYMYLLRVLKYIPQVGGCYHHPEHLNSRNGCYVNLLEKAAVEAAFCK